MTNHDADPLGRWLSVGPDHGPSATLDETLERLPGIRQRPAWVVGLAGGSVDARPADRRLRLALAAIAALLAVGGAIYLAGGRPPWPGPDRSSLVDPSPTLPVTPAPAAPVEVIVYTEAEVFEAGENGCTERFICYLTWVATANADGSGHRRLFPDGPNRQSVIAVSPDGRRVLVTGMQEDDMQSAEARYYLTDLQGSEPIALDTACEGACTGDFIGTSAFSPDGRQLAFVRYLNDKPGRIPDGQASVIAILDLDTGAVTELGSTLARNPDLGQPCHTGCGQGDTEDPRWSPDGRHLLFSRSRVGIPNQPRTILDTQLFAVDADGANLRQLVPTELFARDAQWSPDGALIAFTSAIETLSLDDFGLLENWHQLNDVYTVRPDGTDIRRLTSFTAGPVPEAPGDLGPSRPMWTSDGRIVVQRRVGDPADPGSSASDWELWAMAADGSEASSLGTPDVATLTELGCVVCPFPVPDWGDPVQYGFWRPLP